jgi:copper homeostasis protein
MYTDHEINVMAEDIQMFKEAGVVGVVLGILREDGSVDVGRTQSSVDLHLYDNDLT